MSLCILGGGVAGLATAHYALQSSQYSRIVLVESSNRLGGWIRTVRHRDGVLYEKGRVESSPLTGPCLYGLSVLI